MPRTSTAPADAAADGSVPLPAQRTRRSRAATPPAPLGSLTQKQHQSEDTCPACGGAQLTTLSMTLTDGTPVRFASCRRCEHRRWESAGDELSIVRVLEHTRKPL